MQEIDKKDYDALKYYTDTSRTTIEYHREQEPHLIDEKTEKRLKRLQLISFNKKNKELHNPNYVVTKKGYERFFQLSKIKHRDREVFYWIVTAILALTTIYFFGKNYNWW